MMIDLPMNSLVTELDGYATKEISGAAAARADIIDLSFGQPAFGPPPAVLRGIAEEDLSLETFLAGAKRYETARGSRLLREAIADWYLRRHDFLIDPETEVMVTHGGMEALVLAQMVTTEIGDTVAILDPAYMAYARTAHALGRQVARLARPAGGDEIAAIAAERLTPRARAMIVNSPENPTGYVASRDDWAAVAALVERDDLWLIHDEVYDSMAVGGRPHVPAASIPRLRPRTILVNSFSKKFGLPGLRIGWLVAPARVIEAAAKLHDYLYLGVNIQSERIATRLLSDTGSGAWLAGIGAEMAARGAMVERLLTAERGYALPRRPHGAMFAFPDVRGLHARLPSAYRDDALPAGDAVARFLLEKRKVAVVPGSVYGAEGRDNVRIVLCGSESDFEQGLARMADLP